jgi:methylphosphotriester-DNA--protein-cysteine methyltransferase
MDSLMVGALDPNILNREAGFGVSTDFRFDHGDPEGLNAGLRHLLLLSWRCQHAEFSPAAEARLHPAVRRALSELADGAADPDLGSLARRCGVSASYLSRLFKTQMGIPLTRYRNSARLARFWEACDDPRNGTVLEAVYSAGFGSYAQFFKVFTAAYGKGPREAGWVPGLRALSRAGRAGGAFR